MDRELWVKLLSILYDLTYSPLIGDRTRKELDELMSAVYNHFEGKEVAQDRQDRISRGGQDG